MSWLHRVTQTIAAECGIDAGALALSPDDARDVLDVARVASHTSGDRTNAPLLCYVLGVARGLGARREDLTRAARVAAESAEPAS